jgi:hypothetical protein
MPLEFHTAVAEELLALLRPCSSTSSSPSSSSSSSPTNHPASAPQTHTAVIKAKTHDMCSLLTTFFSFDAL